MAKSTIELLKDFVLTCPLLSNENMNVDYLSDTPTDYSINPLPGERVIKQYADGSSLRQFLFSLTSRENYGSDTTQNIENSSFCEEFSDWLEEQRNDGTLPELENEKQVAQKLETVTSGYLKSSDASSGQYEIQCRLVYLQER